MGLLAKDFWWKANRFGWHFPVCLNMWVHPPGVRGSRQVIIKFIKFTPSLAPWIINLYMYAQNVISILKICSPTPPPKKKQVCFSFQFEYQTITEYMLNYLKSYAIMGYSITNKQTNKLKKYHILRLTGDHGGSLILQWGQKSPMFIWVQTESRKCALQNCWCLVEIYCLLPEIFSVLCSSNAVYKCLYKLVNN